MIVFLLACGPKIPPELYDNAPVQLENCNEESHIFARGIADTPQEAIQDGHRKIAEKIVSELNSETERMSEYIGESHTVNGKTEEKSEALQVFKQKIEVKSSFAHNELIRDVIEPMQVKSGYRSLSCILKDDINRVMTKDIAPKITQFSSLAEQAHTLYTANDTPGFSVQYYKAMELRPEITPDLYIILSATGQRSRLESGFRTAWNQLETEAKDIRSKLNIGLALSGDVGYHNNHTDQTEIFSQPQVLVDGFRKGLENNALMVQTASSCGGALSHFITLRVTTQCNLNSLGYFQCVPAYNANMQDCQTNKTLQLAVYDKKWVGIDRNSTELALSKISEAKHSTIAIRQALKHYFPLLVMN